MNSSELAEKMLQWEKDKRALDVLTSEIEAEVLKLQKTQVVGSVRVTYSGGRATYDWETPARDAPLVLIEKHSVENKVIDWGAIEDFEPDIVEKYTNTEISVDWPAVCKEAKIEPVVVSKTEPTAKIKLEA